VHFVPDDALLFSPSSLYDLFLSTALSDVAGEVSVMSFCKFQNNESALKRRLFFVLTMDSGISKEYRF